MSINELTGENQIGPPEWFVVDTDGRLWVADGHAADEAEDPATFALMGAILLRAGERMEKIYGDQAYSRVFPKFRPSGH